MNTKELKKDTEEKKLYLKHYNAMKNSGVDPAKFGDWVRRRRQTKGAEKIGMTSTNVKQMSGLSEDDYKEIARLMGR